jgi:hypothetical protein
MSEQSARFYQPQTEVNIPRLLWQKAGPGVLAGLAVVGAYHMNRMSPAQVAYDCAMDGLPADDAPANERQTLKDICPDDFMANISSSDPAFTTVTGPDGKPHRYGEDGEVPLTNKEIRDAATTKLRSTESGRYTTLPFALPLAIITGGAVQGGVWYVRRLGTRRREGFSADWDQREEIHQQQLGEAYAANRDLRAQLENTQLQQQPSHGGGADWGAMSSEGLPPAYQPGQPGHPAVDLDSRTTPVSPPPPRADETQRFPYGDPRSRRG